MLNRAIFRGTDIRGKVDQDLTKDVVEKIGRALGTYIQAQSGQTVYLGHDNRLSSGGLANAFARGVVACGSNVIELGLVPTPVLYFATARDKGSFGAMITGSHLPATSNGIKFCKGEQALYGKVIRQIYDITASEEFIPGTGCRTFSTTITEEYMAHVAQLNVKPNLSVVIDCQNGAASTLAPNLFAKLGVSVDCLHCKQDDPYPFERPDPQISANLEPLCRRVKQINADLGIAYDGDADRLGVVDDQGNHVSADRIVAIFARDILTSNPGAKVVFDVLSSQVLSEEIKRNGGTPIAWKSGHSFIKDKLHEEGALLGGESSGHIFFADRYFGYDDGIYASCRLLELLSKSDRPLSHLMGTLLHVFTSPEERPHCPEDKKFQVVEDLEAAFRRENYPLVVVDGVRVQFPKGWGLVRASNTEAVLSLRFEATNADDLEQYRTLVWRKLVEIGHRHGLELASDQDG
jgi:phosphomannomutase/phosphoglucomutase